MSTLIQKTSSNIAKIVAVFGYLFVLFISLIWALFQTYAAYTRYKVNQSLTIYELLATLWPWLAVGLLLLTGAMGIAYLIWSYLQRPKVVSGELISAASPLELAVGLPVNEGHRPILDALSILWRSTPVGEAVSNLVSIYKRGIESAEVTIHCPDDGNPDTLDSFTFSYSRNKVIKKNVPPLP